MQTPEAVSHITPKLRTEVLSRDFTDELGILAQNPPGGDPSLKYFYNCLQGCAKNLKEFIDLIQQVKAKRRDITNAHLTNLLLRTKQYMAMQEGEFGYVNYRSTQEWSADIVPLLLDRKSRAMWGKLLTEKSTTSTIYQRYAGPFAVIAAIFGDRPVVVADLGCGGNYGLRGIELHEPFGPIKDNTIGEQVNAALAQKINLKEGLAVDKQDPDDPEVRDWRLACSFYPQELYKLPQVQAFEERITKSRKVRFVKADLTQADGLPQGCADVVNLSTILYQLQETDQMRLLNIARRLLRTKDGIIIVQDFARKAIDNPDHLTFNEKWHGKGFGYRTFVTGERTDGQFYEVLKWDSGRCREVKPGEDFDKIFKVS